MTYNKNGIPLNRKELVSKSETESTEEAIYELSFAPGIIKRFRLDTQINAFAIVQSYRQDLLYILSKTPSNIERQIRALCGKRLRYCCTAIIEKKGA